MISFSALNLSMFFESTLAIHEQRRNRLARSGTFNLTALLQTAWKAACEEERGGELLLAPNVHGGTVTLG